jgi:putative membrane protein
MNKKTLLKKLNLSQEDFLQIENSVKRAEKETSGEIVVAVAPQSSSYAFWELVSALFTSLALFLCILPMSPQIYSFLQKKIWLVQPHHLSIFFMTVCAIFTILLYLLYNVPIFDRLVIPERAKDFWVSSRAFRFFSESGIYATDNHSGILIFVSYFERQVRIIADNGIAKKIGGDIWKIISDELSENLRKQNARDAFICAIEKCGELLKENFPRTGEKKDQLYNGLLILEDEKWA